MQYPWLCVASPILPAFAHQLIRFQRCCTQEMNVIPSERGLASRVEESFVLRCRGRQREDTRSLHSAPEQLFAYQVRCRVRSLAAPATGARRFHPSTRNCGVCRGPRRFGRDDASLKHWDTPTLELLLLRSSRDFATAQQLRRIRSAETTAVCGIAKTL